MLRFIDGLFEPVEPKYMPNMSEYHAANGGYLSELVKAYDNGGMPEGFIETDLFDIYALSVERCGGMLDCRDLI